MNFEFAILDWFQSVRTPLLDGFFSFITHFGDGGVFWIAVTLLLLAIPKTRRLGLIAAVSLLAEFILCNLAIKPLVARARPYHIREGVELLVKPPKDYSFPSGHSGASFAVAMALCFGKSKPLGIPAVILASFVAISRLYLFIHFPTDVLAGIIIGTLTAYFAAVLIAKLEKRRTVPPRENNIPPE